VGQARRHLLASNAVREIQPRLDEQRRVRVPRRRLHDRGSDETDRECDAQTHVRLPADGETTERDACEGERHHVADSKGMALVERCGGTAPAAKSAMVTNNADSVLRASVLIAMNAAVSSATISIR
jgi:hypothetical protein